MAITHEYHSSTSLDDRIQQVVGALRSGDNWLSAAEIDPVMNCEFESLLSGFCRIHVDALELARNKSTKVEHARPTTCRADVLVETVRFDIGPSIRRSQSHVISTLLRPCATRRNYHFTSMT
jgi:hypothetical protein